MPCHVFYQARAGKEVNFVGHKEYGFDIGVQFAVHVGHLKLVLEIGYGPQSPDYGRGPELFRGFDQKPVKGVDLDFEVRRQVFADERQPIFDRKEGFFFGIGCYGYDDFVKNSTSPFEDVQMSVSDGVKCPRIDGGFHLYLPKGEIGLYLIGF